MAHPANYRCPCGPKDRIDSGNAMLLGSLNDRTAAGPQPLPATLWSELVTRFCLAPDHAQTLRYIERDGHYLGRAVRYLRVFDLARLESDLNTIRQYYDLPVVCVQFEGRIKKDGTVLLRDLRAGLLMGPRPRLRRQGVWCGIHALVRKGHRRGSPSEE